MSLSKSSVEPASFVKGGGTIYRDGGITQRLPYLF